MSTVPSHTDLVRFDNMLATLTPEVIEFENKKQQAESRAEFKLFEENYSKGRCYMCGLKFWDMNISKPCIHWLLRPRKFKKKQFPLIFENFGYLQISAFLHWVANQEIPLKSINNLEEEKGEKKLLSYTIIWKNIEWTFDCAQSDYLGHKGTKSDYPHYHFQMRVDERQFINFNDFHIQFTDYDLFVIDLKNNRGDIYHHSYGPGGSGMQEAMNIDPEYIIENTTSSKSEDVAIYRMNTFIQGGENGIPGELLDKIMEEHEKTGKTMASLAKKYLSETASIESIVMPIDNIPDIASRKGGRGKKK